MIGSRIQRRTAIAVSMAALLAIAASHPAEAAGKDRQAPTAPTNLRITGNTSYSVSLAWGASTDNSGSFVYRVVNQFGQQVTLPQSQTTFTYTNLYPQQYYPFYVLAIDAAGNVSKKSNTVSLILPADTTPPTTPVVQVTRLGHTYVSISWASFEEGPEVDFWVYRDGGVVAEFLDGRAFGMGGLQPSTTYTFTVKGRDRYGNWSQPGSVTLTTAATNPVNDVTPPAAPPGLFDAGSQACEIWLAWSASTDDNDGPELIRYEVFINGVLDHGVPWGVTRTVTYATSDVANVDIYAVDTSGNRSAASSISFDFTGYACH